MKLTVKLFPPYSKKGKPDEQTVHLQVDALDLQQLALYLSRQLEDQLNYALVDDQKLANAEFMVNGKHVNLEHQLQDGDQVAVIPYIGGG